MNASNGLPRVAYFCMEYGLDDRLKTYSGGLGILAGDYLKGAHDHQYPIVGIGLKWKQGYVNQMIDDDGYPIDAFRTYKYDFLEDTGVEVTVQVYGANVRVKVWKCDAFGHVPLYLLDTDLPNNPHSWITGQLYGWFGEERVAQEIVLGIGGVRAMRALGLPIDVYHFNEGHALLAGFELIREKLAEGWRYEDAFHHAKQQIIFTTHTPIPQGNEVHPIGRLMYVGANNGLAYEQLLAMGGEPFNMTVGCLRLSRKANAVAQLHGVTSNLMWGHVDNRADIIAITNGTHVGTWVDPKMLDAASAGADLWAPHQANKQALLDHIEKRTGKQLKLDTLTLGFARRAVTYKRAALIFSDESKIAPLLESGKLQLVFAGKAHPNDESGKLLVQRLVEMHKKYPGVVFLQNYDMPLGAALTRGVDVWLNNPRRPMEASGTSGMKAAMNGVLNCSILDGWWPEACQHGVNGWQFGNGQVFPDVDKQDAHDFQALYTVLINEVIPTYYDQPDRWQAMMQESIQSTRDAFSVKRMLEEYYDLLYQVPVYA